MIRQSFDPVGYILIPAADRMIAERSCFDLANGNETSWCTSYQLSRPAVHCFP